MIIIIYECNRWLSVAKTGEDEKKKRLESKSADASGLYFAHRCPPKLLQGTYDVSKIVMSSQGHRNNPVTVLRAPCKVEDTGGRRPITVFSVGRIRYSCIRAQGREATQVEDQGGPGAILLKGDQWPGIT